MRINDGSICSDCKHFEHDCGNGEFCMEFCEHPDKEVREIFHDDYDYENVITECKGFEN